MDRFIAGPVVWAAGETRLHVYVLPNLSVNLQLRELVHRIRSVIASYPALSPVPDEWLHATVQAITGAPADGVSLHQRTEMVAALRRQVAGMAPFEVTAGAPIADQAGVLLDLDQDMPGEPFDMLSSGVRAAIGEIFGESALQHDPGPPHVTLGYASGPEDSGVVQAMLRRQVRPGRAPMRVDAVYLVDVIQDAALSQYRWRTPIAVIPLTGATT